MRKIIDIIVFSYCIIARYKGIRRLNAAINIANIFFLLNIAAIMNCIIGMFNKLMGIDTLYFDNIVMNVIVVHGIPLILIGFMTLHLLEKVYLNKKGYSRILEIKIPRFWGILIIITHYLISVFFACYSWKFLPHLPPQFN